MNDYQTPSAWSALVRAWQGMVERLFRPADLQAWVVLGFTAWLARVGEGGWQVDFPRDWKPLLGDGTAVLECWRAYAPWILGGVVAVMVFVLALAILLLWVRCRGAFVFLQNVLHRSRAVSGPWRASAGRGQALFVWCLGYAAVMLMAMLLALLPAGWSVLARLAGQSGPGFSVGLGLSVPLLLAWLVAAVSIQSLLHDFVVPCMYAFQASPRAAWRKVLSMVQAFPLAVLAFYGLRLAAGVVIGLAILVGGCLTCCCLWVILVMPVVWAVVLLPALLWQRLYSLEFLRELGPAYDPWLNRVPPLLPPPSPQDNRADTT